MDVFKKLASLLEEQDIRKRIAAAVVLGELKVKDPAIVARLIEMSKEQLEPFAVAALEALGEIGSTKALPALLDALGRGGDVTKTASKAIAKLGPDALPEIRSRLVDASPEVKSALSQLLPAVGGRLSFEMAIEGLRGQSWESVNKVALSVRQEMKTASAGDRKVMRTQIDKFLEKKKTREDEPALRGALKILGFLELPDTADTLFSFISDKHPPVVRMEAVAGLRFALGLEASKKQLKKLIDLMSDRDPIVARAARDTMTVLKIDEDLADEFARLVQNHDLEVARWAIQRLGTLGGAVAEKTLMPVAGGQDRARAEAATQAIAALDDGPSLLAQALSRAEDEVGAQVLMEALMPLAKRLDKKDVKKLFDAGKNAIDESIAVGRRILEPAREVQPETWAKLIAEKADKARKKDPARSASLYSILARSAHASPDDVYTFALIQLERSPLDSHPRGRQRDPALQFFERLIGTDFPLAKTLAKDKAVSDEARYYLGFHFAESGTQEGKSLGSELLEALVEKSPRTKLGKAAKNKLALLGA
ncbi:MAG: HEAT repeat domain-containing protein [Myxococcaceae bacterium]